MEHWSYSCCFRAQSHHVQTSRRVPKCHPPASHTKCGHDHGHQHLSAPGPQPLLALPDLINICGVNTLRQDRICALTAMEQEVFHTEHLHVLSFVPSGQHLAIWTVGMAIILVGRDRSAHGAVTSWSTTVDRRTCGLVLRPVVVKWRNDRMLFNALHEILRTTGDELHPSLSSGTKSFKKSVQSLTSMAGVL